MALAKMVGLVVTPTTCRSRTSRARPPPSSRARLRSSSQIETPAFVSAASGSGRVPAGSGRELVMLIAFFVSWMARRIPAAARGSQHDPRGVFEQADQLAEEERRGG